MSSMSVGSDRGSEEDEIRSDQDDVQLPPQNDEDGQEGPPADSEGVSNDTAQPSSSPRAGHPDGLWRAEGAEVLDDSVSIPDSGPSVQESPLSRRSSASTRRGLRPGPHRPFDLRFQSRISSASSSFIRNSPGPLSSRTPSLVSYPLSTNSDALDSQSAPWDVVRWTKLRKITGQAFSELGKRNFGQPTCLAASTSIVIGTRRGLVLVFDYQQNLKHIIGQGTKATECGAVTSLAISADHTTVGVGHSNGTIFTWEIHRSARPFLTIHPTPLEQAGMKGHDGHIPGASVIHIGFLGTRHTALVSADDRGMAFSHLATRGTGPIGRRVKTTRILGRYPDSLALAGRSRKPSSVLAFSPLPMGNVEQGTDSLGLVAMLTPYLLVIVSTTPVAQTQYKIGRPKELAAHSALTACLAWFPAIKLKGKNEISKTKLAYCWSNVLTVLEVTELPPDPNDADKPPTFAYTPRSRWRSTESIVAVQWISRSVLAVLTLTQQLLILEDKGLRVTDSFDLVNKEIYHIDLFSEQLHSLVEVLHEDDQSMHGVVADAFYMSFRSYKGRLFLMGANDVSVGSLSNWADRLLALMEAGQFIEAIRLATSYYVGASEKLTVGLPEEDETRHELVRQKLLEMMSASVRYAFGRIEGNDTERVGDVQLREFAEASITTCTILDDHEFLFDEVYDSFEEHGVASLFLDALEPYVIEGTVTSLPPSGIKSLVTHYSATRTASHLEEIICQLDVTTMDIDQVTSLCEAYNLYDAYIYVWTQALKDFVGPLAELLSLVPRGDQSENEDLDKDFNNAMKMFPYMSYTLTGRKYPTSEDLDETDAIKGKSEIYGFLFSGDDDQQIRFARLRTMLEFDTASFMSMLNEAFEDSFLNDDADQAQSVSRFGSKASVNRQYIISVLLEVLGPDSGFDEFSAIYLDMFIARNLPKYPQYMLLPGSALDNVLLRLCAYPIEDMLEDCQLSAECLLSMYHPPDIQGFIPALRKAKFFRILKYIYRLEEQYPNLVLTYFDDPEDQESVLTCIRNCMRKNSPLSARQRHEVSEIMETHAAELMSLNIEETAYLVQDVAEELHEKFVQALELDEGAQYYYLQVLLQPVGRRSKAQATLPESLIQLYVYRMCTYDPQHVAEFIDEVSDRRQGLHLEIESILSLMEDRGAVDAAVVLMTRQGEIQRAMDRLVKHLDTLKTGLVGILESNSGQHDQVEDLALAIEKYGRVGVWLCRRYENAKVLKGKGPANAADPGPWTKKDRDAALSAPLNFKETLWLSLIESIVHITRSVTPLLNDYRAKETNGDHEESNGTLPGRPERKDPVSILRNLVQEVFTALLRLASDRTAATKRTDMTFLRILRAFLGRAATTSPSLNELRSVLADMFSAYTYEESLLTLANSMLDKDLFVHVDEVANMRQRGWRPRGRLCEICRRKVWGPGAGEHVWSAWEAKRSGNDNDGFDVSKATSRRGSHIAMKLDVKGKGKAPAETETTPDENATGLVDLNANKLAQKHVASPLLIFACRHVYHQECLHRKNEQRSTHDGYDRETSQELKPRCIKCAVE